MHSYKKKIGFLFDNSNVLLNYLPVIHLHFPSQNGERERCESSNTYMYIYISEKIKCGSHWRN